MAHRPLDLTVRSPLHLPPGGQGETSRNLQASVTCSALFAVLLYPEITFAVLKCGPDTPSSALFLLLLFVTIDCAARGMTYCLRSTFLSTRIDSVSRLPTMPPDPGLLNTWMADHPGA